MLTEISWSSYITFMIALLVIYYLFIGFTYYRSDLLQLFSGKELKPNQILHQENLQQAFQKQDMFQVSQSLGNEIMAYLSEAGRETLSKEDILQSLKLLIARYPSIKDSAFREVIQNLILTESETNCSIHLSEKELSEVW